MTNSSIFLTIFKSWKKHSLWFSSLVIVNHRSQQFQKTMYVKLRNTSFLKIKNFKVTTFSGHYSNAFNFFILLKILFKLLSQTVKQCKKFFTMGNSQSCCRTRFNRSQKFKHLKKMSFWKVQSVFLHKLINMFDGTEIVLNKKHLLQERWPLEFKSFERIWKEKKEISIYFWVMFILCKVHLSFNAYCCDRLNPQELPSIDRYWPRKSRLSLAKIQNMNLC